MNLRLKFTINDRVYSIVKNKPIYKKQVCHICDGQKYVIIKENTFQCPYCKGNVKNQIMYYSWGLANPLGAPIDAINIDKTNRITYQTNYYYCTEEDIFTSKEEAEKECNKRNEIEFPGGPVKAKGRRSKAK